MGFALLQHLWGFLRQTTRPLIKRWSVPAGVNANPSKEQRRSRFLGTGEQRAAAERGLGEGGHGALTLHRRERGWFLLPSVITTKAGLQKVAGGRELIFLEGLICAAAVLRALGTKTAAPVSSSHLFFR